MVIATGRPYRMAKDFYDQLELETPMINFNGRSLTYLVELGNMKMPYCGQKYLLDIVKRKEEIEADFIAGEYRKKFYITAPDKKIANPKLFGVENFRPENQFKSDLVTKGPNCILLQTRADDNMH